jgi:hypothetical protein
MAAARPATLTAEDAWRWLRMPFVLPQTARKMHVCRWELIDFDCAGCVVCGHVHRCSAGTCTDVVTTDDAVVCTVTGVCVDSQRFADNEYSDNVIVYASSVNVSDVIERRMQAVDTYVHEFLVSANARSICAYEHTKRLNKHRAHVARVLRTGSGNLLQLVQLGMPVFMHTHFDTKRRCELAQMCTHHVQRVICTAQRVFDLAVKDSELRHFVFGMLYLMCRGVHMHGVQILPHIPELVDVMPSENNVSRFTHFRAKHITETENKFKFVFRRATPDQLRNMNLNAKKQGVPRQAPTRTRPPRETPSG